MNDLLEQARKGTPVVESNAATFVWYGERAPQLIGDWTGWEGSPPVDLVPAAPGVWTYRLPLPPDAYLEYAYLLDGARVPDPLNPHTVDSGIGRRNHYFYMPQAWPTPLARCRPSVPHGTVTRHQVKNDYLVVGGQRSVDLYRPPAVGPCPLLVVLDGQDYGRRGHIVSLIDNLLVEGRIRPIALALVYHGRQARAVEYACNDATLAFLSGPVLDLAREQLDLVDVRDRPGAYGILGASLGGLMSLFAGLRAPGLFGRVLSQSGGFDFPGGEPCLWDLARNGPVRPVRIWMDVGRFEWLTGTNRRLHELLVERGYDVEYREHNGGHNYTSWRNNLVGGLERLFGRTGD